MSGGTASPLPRLILCADDFGLDPGIDAAILDLAASGRINAVSCMTGGASWRRNAPALRELQPSVMIGLHLTLTDLPPLGAMPELAPAGGLPCLGTLMRHVLLRQSNGVEIRDELRRQHDAFCQTLGRPPAHLDGHQHVHCFPVIRDVVLEMAEKSGAFVRVCATSWADMAQGRAAWTKALTLNLLGAGFAAALEARGIPHNQQFFGLHAFDPGQDCAVLYQRWLAAAQDGALINCHPAQSVMPDDPIAAWRRQEYEFLHGAGWQQGSPTETPSSPPQRPSSGLSARRTAPVRSAADAFTEV